MGSPFVITNDCSEGRSPVFPPFLRVIFRRFFRLDAYVLTDKALDEAKQLIYNVYYREQHWVPPRGNPSNLRYENGRIRDNLEKMSTWIGVYREKSEGRELVAVCRVVSGLEFQRYLPHFMLASIPARERSSCELNRLAIRKDCRHGMAFPFLVLAWTFCAYRMGFHTMFGASFPRLLEVLQWLGHTFAFRFRYHPSDPEVMLVYMPLTLRKIIFIMLRLGLLKVRTVILGILRKIRSMKVLGFTTGKSEQFHGAHSMRPARL